MYIDNLLLGGDTPLLKEFKSQLMSRFAMTDMEDASMVLGMQIARDREAKTLTIRQKHYARSVTARFGMEKYNPVHTTEQEWRFLSQAAGHDATRLYGHPTLPGHHTVAHVPEPMYSIRRHLRRQPTGPSHEQTVQTTHYSTKERYPLPKGRYGPGNHVHNRVF